MRFPGASLLAATALLTTPASALIVVDGKIVREWPDQPRRAAGARSGAQLAQVGLGFYPAPKGVVRGLTMLVDFSDESPAFSVDEVDAWLNEPGFSEDGLNGSVRDYYFDNSNGAVDLQNQVVGFYRASRPKSYYEAATDYSRAGELVAELFAAIDDEVDFSLFDNDGDGRTEAISIVYAGYAENWAQGLWPHSGYLNNQLRDGVRISRYQMTSMEERFDLYTFVHEVGHMVFGWPDLYGFGSYCVMGNSSNATNPVGINDFYRADQGWIPVIDLTAATNRRYYANVNAGGYRFVNPERPDEAFFWSNIQNTGRWSALRGNGLVVLHFDAAIEGNDPPNPLGLAVVQADGQRELDQEMWPDPGSEQADFYTASGDAELSASTNPSSAWNDRSASGLRLYDVSASGESMTFTVGTGTPEPGIGGAGGTGGAGGLGGAGGAGALGGAGAAAVGGSAGAGTAGAGGLPSSAGMAGTGGAEEGGASGAGGAPGGTAGAGKAGAAGAMTNSGGTAGNAGAAGRGGSTSAGAGGSLAGAGGGITSGRGGTTGGASSGAAGMPNAAPPDAMSEEEAGCGCRVTGTGRAGAFSVYGLAVVAMLVRRRRASRR